MLKFLKTFVFILWLLFLNFDFSFANTVIEESHNYDLNITKAIITSLIMWFLILVIAFETTHRTMATFLAVSILLWVSHTVWFFFPDFNLLTLTQAFQAIDGEVITLLAWMMIIIWVLSDTGIFERTSYKLFDISKGKPLKLLFLFIILTATLSTFLNNVTTIFLVTPVAVSIAKILKVNAVWFIMPMIMASNIWWAATLIWDPPNIMIWSFAKLSFNDFLINMWLPTIFIIVIFMINMYFVYGRKLNENEFDFEKEVVSLREKYKIKHIKLLKVSLTVLWFVILFFLLHWIFHMPVAVPALVWAWVLMFLRDRIIMEKHKKHYKNEIEEIRYWILKAFEKDIEWPVLAFFIFIFMVVASIENSWALEFLANTIKESFGNNLLVSALVILWVSAIISAFLDNIPFTAVMLPIIAVLIWDFWEAWNVLWWALAFWACLWGNGTLIWASANIVAVWLLEKEWYKISFKDFFKVWFSSMLLQVFVATIAIVIMIKI